MRVLLSLFPLFLACSPILPIENPLQKPTANEMAQTVGVKRLTLLVLDVGQGDATLVIGPSGRTLLIDGGPPGSGIGRILPTLESRGIDHLHWIVATHYDTDHIGGIPEVLKGPDLTAGTEDDRVPFLGFLDRGDRTDQETPVFFDYLETAAPLRKEAEPGLQLDLGDGAVAQVIVVNGRYANGRSVHLNPDEENEASIGLLIRYGSFEYFTAGDLPGGGAPGGYETKDLETIAGEVIGDIDILHVGHHGSSSSTNENFLGLTMPEAAVISVGKDNDYGHPTETVLKRLKDSGTSVHRTDLMGTLEIQTDGDFYEIAPR